MSPNAIPNAEPCGTTPAAPRAPYVPPTLEALGSWSALTMQTGGGGLGGGGGFVQNPIISRILRGVR